jgi:hypothetical protein
MLSFAINPVILVVSHKDGVDWRFDDQVNDLVESLILVQEAKPSRINDAWVTGWRTE